MNHCPDDETLSLYLDRELPAPEAGEVEAHLNTCPRCSRELALLDDLEDMLRPETGEASPPDLLARIRSLPDRKPAARRPLRMAVTLAAAASVFAVVVLSHRSPAPESIDGTPPLRERVLSALVRPDPASRQYLDDLGASALVVLHRIAEGEDSLEARAAIGRLGALGRRESLPSLIGATRSPDRREAAVRALARLGDRRAVPVLEEMLAFAEVEHLALSAMASLGGPDAVRILADRIDSERDRPEAPHLVLLLAGIGTTDAGRALLPMLRDPDLGVYAARALSVHRRKLLPGILRLAQRGATAVRGAAISALARLRAPEAVPVLRELLRDRRLRFEAACALGRIETGEAVGALIAHLRYPEVREAFDRAGPSAEEHLIVRLYEKSLSVRQTAVELLARCGGSRAVRALAPLAEEPRLAPHVLHAIGSIGGEAAVAALNDLADNPRLRRGALLALAATGHPSAARLLARRGIESPRIRGGDPAVRALARMDPGLVAPVLNDLARTDGGGRAHRLLAALSLSPRPGTRPGSTLD